MMNESKQGHCVCEVGNRENVFQEEGRMVWRLQSEEELIVFRNWKNAKIEYGEPQRLASSSGKGIIIMGPFKQILDLRNQNLVPNQIQNKFWIWEPRGSIGSHEIHGQVT